MAANKSTRSKGSSKNNSKGTSKTTSKRRPSSAQGSGKKVSAQTAYYIKRNRFIKGLVLLGISILCTLLFFLEGENLWRSLHEGYRGLFGFLGFLPPLILLYCAVQMFKEKSTYRFALKVFFFCGTMAFLGSTIFAFSSQGMEMQNYGIEMGNCFREGALNGGIGAVGGLFGILFGKLLGAVAGGLVSLLVLCFFMFMSFEALFMNIIDRLKEPVNDRISEHKEVRSRVREEQNRIRTENRRKTHEENVNRKVDKKLNAIKKKAAESDMRRINKTPIYEPEIPHTKTSKQPEIPVPQPEKTPPINTTDGIEGVIPDTKPKSPKPKHKPQPKPESMGYINEETDIFADTIDISALVKKDSEKSSERYDSAVNTVFAPAMPAKPASVPTSAPVPMAAPQPAAKPVQETKELVKPAELTASKSASAEVGYLKPPFTLLEPQPKDEEENINQELHQSATKLVETLKSFGVPTTITNICRGPSVTRYELQPATGVKISKITNLSDDIAMNLAATGVRIEAPIPGKNAVGIEVPNRHVTIVKMRNLVESKEFQTAKSRLTVVLGKDITGKITLADLSRMPHLLIAGSTGSGKSVCINSMLVSLLYKSTPEEVKLILIDPKVVELGVYNGIPHLLIPVVTDPRKAAGALNWAVNEMLERYKTFAEYNVRDMHSYNRLVDKQNAEVVDNYLEDSDRTFEEDEMLAQAQAELKSEGDKPREARKMEKMSQIVIVIDELADLMMAAPNEVEESICRLAQMARAAGMHLVIATQRPSVDVITGLIKANVPSRIAFAVKTQIDSRTILDSGGADKLLGRGDMLYSPIGTTKPVRVQGCYVDDDEIEHIVDFIKHNKTVEYDKDVIDEIERIAIADSNSKAAKDTASDGEVDAVMEQAIQCVVEAGQASTSLLQRRLRLGYARAGRLIDEMEQMGIVGPHEGSKPRQVLMTYQQWLERNMARNETE